MNRPPQSTPEQVAAIAEPGNVLVMAGAGTGKTRTLVDRCLAELGQSTNPVSLESVLMVTFTEAAAGEMRQRLRAALAARLDEQPDNPWWVEQYALVDSARISTLHGFCLQLIRDHAHEIGWDPGLWVMSEGQARVLAAEVIESLFERHFAGHHPVGEAVQQLVLEVGRGSDQPVRSLVQRLHDHSQALADPAAWFRDQTNLLSDPAPRSWSAWLVDGFQTWRAHWMPELERRSQDIVKAAGCAEALRCDGAAADRSTAATALRTIAELDAEWPRGTKKLRKPLETFFADAQFLLSLAEVSDNADPLFEDWTWVRPQLETLVLLVREFGEDYAKAKRLQGSVDFHDLEQFALRLLWDVGQRGPTPLARRWREQLRLVFVDEYQDINEAQDTILRALGREGPEANRFLVGDVKQSIYRFRLANPGIFQAYADAWSRPEGAGRLLALTGNFRSRPGILDFVNGLFSTLLRREVGGIDYTEDQWLRPGAAPGAAAGTGEVEFHLLIRDRSPADGEEEESAMEREARFVAERLQRLKTEGLAVRDRDTHQPRALRWGDIAVLLRSPSARAEVYARAFAAAGVPLQVERRGFLDALEVGDLINLLHILDNPLQDWPLLAVLRSPIAGFEPNDLAILRMAHRKGPLWTALRRLVRREEGKSETPTQRSAHESAQAKAVSFVAQYQRWRALARAASLSECLETALEESAYEAWLAAEPVGEAALANVRQLLRLTRQFDHFQRQGLHRFLRFVEALREEGRDLDVGSASDPDAVRLLSVHQSKGLEFPVVVVAELGKRFNLQDLQAPVILDEQYGICPMVRPPGVGQRYPSLTHWLAGQRQHRATLGEELRLLYVACTRAQDRLILCGSATPRAVGDRWPEMRPPLTTVQLVSAKSWLDWLGPWMTTAAGGALEPGIPGSRGSLAWSIHDPKANLPLEVALDDSPDHREHGAVDWENAALEPVRQRLHWTYPQRPAAGMAAKLSVSQIRRRIRDETDDEARSLFIAPLPRHPEEPQELDPVTVGQAHHRVLESLPLESPVTQGRLLDTVDRLTTRRVLSRAEAQQLDLPSLLDFWQSELGRRIQHHAASVQRELPFTARVSPADLEVLGMRSAAGIDADEFVVVQGVADLVVLHTEGIWLIDFKTDRVDESQLVDRVRDYMPQLRLYALALEGVYRRPVTERWLHFLHLRRTVAA